ncbi:MAG: NYN domain-containing protein [Gemmataceae bacterium]
MDLSLVPTIVLILAGVTLVLFAVLVIYLIRKIHELREPDALKVMTDQLKELRGRTQQLEEQAQTTQRQQATLNQNLIRLFQMTKNYLEQVRVDSGQIRQVSVSGLENLQEQQNTGFERLQQQHNADAENTAFEVTQLRTDVQTGLTRVQSSLQETQTKWDGVYEVVSDKLDDHITYLKERLEEQVKVFKKELRLSQDNRLAVAIDFENYYLGLAQQHFKIDPVSDFVKFLANPTVSSEAEERSWIIKSMILYTNQARWKGKWYRATRRGGRNKETQILRRDAQAHLDELQMNGFQVVYTEANVDVQLAFEILELVEKGGIDRLVLVANDNTYAALVALLTKRGVSVNGVGIGPLMGGELARMYKQSGAPAERIDTDLSFIRIEKTDSKKTIEEPQLESTSDDENPTVPEIEEVETSPLEDNETQTAVLTEPTMPVPMEESETAKSPYPHNPNFGSGIIEEDHPESTITTQVISDDRTASPDFAPQIPTDPQSYLTSPHEEFGYLTPPTPSPESTNEAFSESAEQPEEERPQDEG